MRNFVAAIVAATLIATSALAAANVAAPLPSGKAAGVSKAQDKTLTVAEVVAGGVVVAGFVLLGVSNGNSTLVTGTTTTTR